MDSERGFAELLRRHEELTQRFSRLLHDDAGQILTAIALRLTALEGVPPGELADLTSALDELLDRFRAAQNFLGASVVRQRGLAAGLSLWRHTRPETRITGLCDAEWTPLEQLAIFRIIEALEPHAIHCHPFSIELKHARSLGDYEQMIAQLASLSIESAPNAHTIKIGHANTGSDR
ncbi:MAG: hypothetical protein ACK5TN_05310 [Acidobacteriota bacterium]|jgi:hypothetical protein